MFHFSRFPGVCLWVAGGTLLASIAGCGGGGAGVSSPTSTPTPNATTISAACDTSTYSPNYYGLPDPSVSTDSQNVYTFWRQFPITVYIQPSSDPAFRASTLAGFEQWVTATSGRVDYQLVNSASGANLVVSFAAQDPNDDTLGLTTVTYSGSSHIIDHAKMELLLYTTDQRSDAAAANQSIAAHEFGHALGIGAHSPFTADLMYPYLERAKENVTTRDLNTLKTVYCNNFPTRSLAALKPLQGPFLTKVFRTKGK